MKNVLLGTAMTLAFINVAHGHGNDDSFCPNKDTFKAALASHLKEASEDTFFQFNADSQDGSGKAEEWKATGFRKKDKDAKWDDASRLKITYKTKKKVNTYCEAQFHDGRKKQSHFIIYLHKKEK